VRGVAAVLTGALGALALGATCRSAPAVSPAQLVADRLADAGCAQADPGFVDAVAAQLANGAGQDTGLGWLFCLAGQDATVSGCGAPCSAEVGAQVAPHAKPLHP
jgi:hypothetical protein